MKNRYNQVLAECAHLEDQVEDAVFSGNLALLREVQEQLAGAQVELHSLKDQRAEYKL